MMQIFNEMFQSLFEPARLHAIVVHFPIAISVIGLIMLVVFSFMGGANHGWRWACVVVYALGASTAFLASYSGDAAMDHAMPHISSDAVHSRLAEHAEMGAKVWVFLAVTTTLAALTAIPYNGPRIGFLVLSVVSALATVGWVGVTAHYGGDLVYTRAVGVEVPQAAQELPPLRPFEKPASRHATKTVPKPPRLSIAE